MRLVPSRRLAHCLVARREQYDREEGYDERAGAGDAPAAEDDAQVGCVPSEEHLLHRASVYVDVLVGNKARTFMLHWGPGPMPGMSWSMWP
jgi:hypothetical protein